MKNYSVVHRDAIAFVVARLNGDRFAAALILADYTGQPDLLSLAIADLFAAAIRRTEEPRLDEQRIREWLGDLGLACLETEGP